MLSRRCSYDLPLHKRGPKTSGMRRKTKTSERRTVIVETSGVDEGLAPSLTDGPACSTHEDPIMEKIRRKLVDSISSQYAPVL